MFCVSCSSAYLCTTAQDHLLNSGSQLAVRYSDLREVNISASDNLRFLNPFLKLADFFVPVSYIDPLMSLNTVYEPIQRDEIRLVKFSRCDGEHTSAIIQSFSIQKGPVPPYFASSYTWSCENSGATHQHMLQIGKQQLLVLDSLQSFFHVLSFKDAGGQVEDVWW